MLAVPGVARRAAAHRQFGKWKRPDGADEGILVVGFDSPRGMGRPWNIVARLDRPTLEQADAVIVDELYNEKLGVTRIGQTLRNPRRPRPRRRLHPRHPLVHDGAAGLHDASQNAQRYLACAPTRRSTCW